MTFNQGIHNIICDTLQTSVSDGVDIYLAYGDMYEKSEDNFQYWGELMTIIQAQPSMGKASVMQPNDPWMDTPLKEDGNQRHTYRQEFELTPGTVETALRMYATRFDLLKQLEKEK